MGARVGCGGEGGELGVGCMFRAGQPKVDIVTVLRT